MTDVTIFHPNRPLAPRGMPAWRRAALAAWLAAAPVMAGCGDHGDDGPRLDVTAALGDEGGGLLSDEDLARLEGELDDVIARGESTVAALESEIAALEQINQEKAAEIDQLVIDIEERRVELEEQFRRNLILCLFFPNPATCILANFINNDSRMKQLVALLAQARAEQDAARADIRRFGEKRDALRAQLVPLRESKELLIDRFRAGLDAGVPPAELAESPETGAAFVRAGAITEIADLIADEIDILLLIRSAAIELAASLDAAVATLQVLVADAEALVRAARDDFMRLLKGLLSGDPAAAAEEFLEDALAAKTKEILAKLGWPVAEFIAHLISTGGGDSELAELLRAKLCPDGTCADEPG